MSTNFNNFITRWFFSTNHKCGVLISSVLGGYNPYRHTVTIKLKVTHSNFNRGVKRTFPVNAVMSLGKRTSIITTSFSEANLYDSEEVFSSQRSTLLYGGKRPCDSGILKDRFGFSAANSQSLGETQYSGGRLRHDYEIGLLRLEKGGKPLSLRGSLGNVALLSGSKRSFSSGEPHGFKKLSAHKKVNIII
jgi:hypothetical protein